MPDPARLGTLDRVLYEQQWLSEHGGDLAGYVRRYGSADDERHYGDGGEAIYAADSAALDRALDAYERRRRTSAIYPVRAAR